MECNHCKSSNVITNIEVTGGDTIRPFGVLYAEKKVWTKTEPIMCEICKDCGNVRFYVQNTNRNWKQIK